MKLVTRAAGLAVIILAGIGSAAVAIMMTDRQPPIVYEQVQALADSVPQGGTIDVEFTVFRLRICDATARRFLTDAAGQRHAIPTFTVGPRMLAGRDTYRRSITIPDATAVGVASYQVTIEYTCNVFHRLGWPIEVISPPIRFDVTPGPIIILPPMPSQPQPGDG